MYEVRFYQGDYNDRQAKANEDQCIAYVEHHFNSSSNVEAGYSMVVTGANASQTSINWGRWYAGAVSRGLDVSLGGDRGVVVGGYNGLGDYNLRYTDMPAVLLEPLFASNPWHATRIRDENSQAQLAGILSESIQRFFPQGGVVGFSVGHKYKESNPNDRGASVYGGGTEADYAEIVLNKAKILLESVSEVQTKREVRVLQGTDLLWAHTIDADTSVTWDPVLGVLQLGSISG